MSVAAAGPRSRRMDIVPTACRARPRIRIDSARRTVRRGAPCRTARRHPSLRWPPSRRSAGRGRRADCEDSGCFRSRPSCIARVTAAQATRSPRNLGTITPRLAAPMVWPARPMRCMPLATEGGASIWTTRSIAPMSMPSSSEDVATRPRMAPGLQPIFHLDALRAGQRSVMRSHQRLAGQLVQCRGQPLRDAAAVHEDQRRAVRANELEQPGWMADQIDVRTGPCEAGRSGFPRLRRSSPCPRPAPRCEARDASSLRCRRW